MNGDSRYSISEVKEYPTSTGPVRRYEMWWILDIDISDHDTYAVQISDIGRLDNVSSKYYGVPDYWWAIALANNIKNQFFDMRVGQVLIVPKIAAINDAIASRMVNR